jgi:hypothetical protein
MAVGWKRSFVIVEAAAFCPVGPGLIEVEAMKVN